MGADLLLSVLEIPIGKEPAWDKAESLFTRLTKEELVNACCNALGCEEIDLPDSPRERILEALQSVIAGWDNGRRLMSKVSLSKTVILVAGDSSWGDSVSEVEDMNLFIESGLAKAAGFLL